MSSPYDSIPFGLSLATFLPSAAPDRRDLLDFQGSNTIQTARYINPVTQDFVESSNNHFQGMNSVEQEVILALNTTFNSAVLGFGQKFTSVPVITPYIKKQMTTYLNQALQILISNGDVILNNDIQISANQFGQVSISFSYINTTLGTVAPVSYQIQLG